MTLAELLRACNHDNWWQDDVQVYFDADGALRPVNGVTGAKISVSGKQIVILASKRRKEES